ncbi:MAG TPA: hypothetical protein VIM56_07325 [Rhizomicrobium sp.]
MGNSLCLLAHDPVESWTHVLPVLASCGLDVWIAPSAEACLSDGRSTDMLCLIVDLPLEYAEISLEMLRIWKVRAPALLVADPEEAPLRRSDADWMDVLSHPIDVRTLLGWVECVCAAHIAIHRARGERRNFPLAA